MPFISRKESNEIFGLYSCEQYKNQEFLPDTSAEVIAFRVKKINANKVLIRERIIKMQRTSAIAELKSEGKLPADYKEK